jgi:hypothetical protein
MTVSRAFVRRGWPEVIEVLRGELFGEYEVVSVTAVPGSDTVQDRFAVGGEIEVSGTTPVGSKSRR